MQRMKVSACRNASKQPTPDRLTPLPSPELPAEPSFKSPGLSPVSPGGATPVLTAEPPANPPSPQKSKPRPRARSKPAATALSRSKSLPVERAPASDIFAGFLLNAPGVPVKRYPYIRKGITRYRDHPPRPSNSFMLFRVDQIKKLETAGPEVDRKAAVASISELWNQVSQEVRDEYKAKAIEAKAQHAIKYPEYVYRPFGAHATRPRYEQSKRSLKTKATKAEATNDEPFQSDSDQQEDQPEDQGEGEAAREKSLLRADHSEQSTPNSGQLVSEQAESEQAEPDRPEPTDSPSSDAESVKLPLSRSATWAGPTQAASPTDTLADTLASSTWPWSHDTYPPPHWYPHDYADPYSWWRGAPHDRAHVEARGFYAQDEQDRGVSLFRAAGAEPLGRSATWSGSSSFAAQPWPHPPRLDHGHGHMVRQPSFTSLLGLGGGEPMAWSPVPQPYAGPSWHHDAKMELAAHAALPPLPQVTWDPARYPSSLPSLYPEPHQSWSASPSLGNVNVNAAAALGSALPIAPYLPGRTGPNYQHYLVPYPGGPDASVKRGKRRSSGKGRTSSMGPRRASTSPRRKTPPILPALAIAPRLAPGFAHEGAESTKEPIWGGPVSPTRDLAATAAGLGFPLVANSQGIAAIDVGPLDGLSAAALSHPPALDPFAATVPVLPPSAFGLTSAGVFAPLAS